MSPEIGQAGTRIALFLIVSSLLLMMWVERGSAEFVVLTLTIVVGLAMLVVVALLARMGTAPRTRKTRNEHERREPE